MKAYLAGVGILVLGFVTPVIAADLPAKARSAPPVVAPSWTGFYLGAHGGYGWGNSPFREPFSDPGDDVVGSIGGFRSRGWVFGGHAGYNWQYGSIVTGLEVDFSAADIKGSNSATASDDPIDPFETMSLTLQDRVKYLGSARARLGVLPTDGVLLYGTAGLGWQRLERTRITRETTDFGGGDVFVNTNTVTTPIDRFGWVAGAGAEARLFGSNWLVRVEYLHYDFGQFERSHNIETFSGDVELDRRKTSGRQTIDIVRGGLSYKFGPH